VIDYKQNPAYLGWAENILGVNFAGNPAVWLTSLDQAGNILGVVVFSSFTKGNCEVTVAAVDPRFITRRFAIAVAAYAFIQMECRRVTAMIAVENAKSLSLAQRLGFRMEGTAREWFPGGDAYILGLLKKDCDWLKDSHGKQPRHPSDS
jgi:RimJ/RimL family protein N-acetyltransferase